MTTSVIIPTYNAQEYLPALLEKLRVQTAAFELIIIDSSSKDDTVTIAKRYTDKIIIIPQSEFDHGGTRTEAAKTASGEIVVFLTQDALPVDNYAIERIIKAFEDTHIGAAYGRQIPYPDTTLFGKHLRGFNYPETSHIRSYQDRERYGMKTVFLSDSFAAYRVTSLKKIDWIKNGLISSEDSYAGAKMLLADYSLAYVSDAQVYHSHSYSVIEEFKRYFDIGVFYRRQKWILESFGKAEGEGGRYVKSEFRYLLKHNAYLKIPEFFIRNGMKYLGYKLGQHYENLPKGLIQKISMHPLWWKKLESTHSIA
ncbi:MAG: glycosyltransferase family 2 protein [Campylobacterota bacterium]|nr:glycosyltransferase family 2 protein [Campylobacterota bacterium]